MTQSKKDRKKSRRAQAETLRKKLQAVKEKVREEPATAITVDYVLSEGEGEEELNLENKEIDAVGLQRKDAHPDNKPLVNEEDDEDRVHLPATSASEDISQKLQHKNSSSNARKKHKMSWEALKMAVHKRYGVSALEVVEEHDGDAEDPFFTIAMKLQERSVHVPRHWDKLRSFMSNQADRETAATIIPAEIEALRVDKLRAKEKKASINQKALVTCFLTGSPLRRKTFAVPLSDFGSLFYEGKWIPKTRYLPGVYSENLRRALGMGTSSSSPPPWLYGMQAIRRLPPGYTNLQFPGVNAPIPAGAQWGRAQGQWGEAPRAANKSFLFRGVMDESVGAGSGPVLWGSVPPISASASNSAAPAETPAAPAPAVRKTAAPAPSTAPKVAVNPVPFTPSSYQPNARNVAPVVPREYTRVQDSGSGVVAGHKMVPKAPEPK